MKKKKKSNRKRWTWVRVSDDGNVPVEFVEAVYAKAFAGMTSATPHRYLEFAVEDALREVADLLPLMVAKIMEEHPVPKINPAWIPDLNYGLDRARRDAKELLGFASYKRRREYKLAAARAAAKSRPKTAKRKAAK